MGLLKSVISDARPAKPAGKSAYAQSVAPGRSTGTRRGEAEAGSARRPVTVESPGGIGGPDSHKGSYSSASADRPVAAPHTSVPGRDPTGPGNRLESPAVALDAEISRDSANVIYRPRTGGEQVYRRPGIDPSRAVPWQQSGPAVPDMPAFTFADRPAADSTQVGISQAGGPGVTPATTRIQSEQKTPGTGESGAASRSNTNVVVPTGPVDEEMTAAMDAKPGGESKNPGEHLSRERASSPSAENLLDTRPLTESILRGEKYKQATAKADPATGPGVAHESTVHDPGDEAHAYASTYPPALSQREERDDQVLEQVDRWRNSVKPQQTGMEAQRGESLESHPAGLAESRRDSETQDMIGTLQQQQRETHALAEDRAGLVEARSETLRQEKSALHFPGDYFEPATTNTHAAQSPQVNIGQVDVFIERPAGSTARESGTSTSRPSPSLASRHYLRRL